MQQQDVKTGKNDSKEDPNSITNILAMVISILDWLKNAKGTKNELDCPEVCEVSEAVDKLRDMTEKLAEGKCDHGEEPCNCNEDSDTDADEEIFYETQENVECIPSKQFPSTNKCKGVDCKKCCASGGSVPKSTDENNKGEGQVEVNTMPQVADNTVAPVADNTVAPVADNTVVPVADNTVAQVEENTTLSSAEAILPSSVITPPADDKSKDELTTSSILTDSKKSPKKRNKKAKKASADRIVELPADSIVVDDDDEKDKDTTPIAYKGSRKPCNVKKAKKASDDRLDDDDGRDKNTPIDVILIPDDEENKDKGDELNTTSDDKEPSKDDGSEKDRDTPPIEAEGEESKDKDNELNANTIAIPLQDKPSTEADDEKSKDKNADIIAVDDDDKKEKDAAAIIVLDDETSKDKNDELSTGSLVQIMDTPKEPETIHGDAEKPSADTNMDPSKVSSVVVVPDSPEKPTGLEDKQKPDENAKDRLNAISTSDSVPVETSAADKPKDATAMKECSQCSQTADQLDQAVSAKRTKNFCDCPPTQPAKTDSSTRMNQANVDTEEKTTQAQQCKALYDEQQALVDNMWIPPCRHGPKTYSGRRRAQQGGYRVPEASEDETMDDDDDEGTFYECTRYPSPTRTLVPVRKPKQPDPYRIQCPQFISSLPYQPSRMPPRNTYGPKGGIAFKSYQPCPASRGQSPYEPSTGAPLYGTPVKSKSPTSPPVSSSPYKYNIPASDCARRLIQTIMKNPTCPAYEALKKAAETPETATEDELYTGPTTTGDGSPKSFSSSPKSGGCNDDCLGKKKSTSGSPT